MGAPVCVIAPQFQQPSAPAVLIPSIPVANATNVVAVVNAIRTAIIGITGQNTNTGSNNDSFSVANPGTPPPPPTPQNGFTVTNQVVTQVTIKDPASGASVVINQVTGLTMKDSVTGQTWTWNAPSGLNQPQPASGS
jgi:hypothetical protein